jgi:hypothetical protein
MRIAVAVLVVVGGVAAWSAATTDPSVPLHFWVEDASVPPRPFDAPRGRELTSVRAEWRDAERDHWLQCTAGAGPVERLLAVLGRRPADPVVFSAFPVRLATSSPGWQECLVDFCPDPQLIRAGHADPALVGEWEEIGPLFPRSMELKGDGSMVVRILFLKEEETQRWCRLGDLFLRSGTFAGRDGVWVLGVIDPDGKQVRGIGKRGAVRVR